MIDNEKLKHEFVERTTFRLTDIQLREILKAASSTPSGDNCQPWTFSWDGLKLDIIHDPIRAAHPLNPGCMSSILTLGLLLEAIDLAASKFYLKTIVELEEFTVSQSACWVHIRFVTSANSPNPLADSLEIRCTDRRNYSGGTLPTAKIYSALDGIHLLGEAQLHFIEKIPSDLLQFAVQAEQTLITHRLILPAILKCVRFSKREAHRTQDGLLWRNLGIQLWELPTMLLLRSIPSLLRVLKYVMAPVHRHRVRKQMRSSAGLVCVSIPAQEADHMVAAGQLAMRAWLQLNKMEFGVQPMTLPSLIMYLSLIRMPGLDLNEQQREFFKSGDPIIRKAFNIPDGHVCVWMLRTGKSQPLPYELRTLRKPIQVGGRV